MTGLRPDRETAVQAVARELERRFPFILRAAPVTTIAIAAVDAVFALPVVVDDAAVERAAIAAFNRDTMDGHHKGGPWTWESIPEMGRCNYRLTVRAALAAAEAER